MLSFIQCESLMAPVQLGGQTTVTQHLLDHPFFQWQLELGAELHVHLVDCPHLVLVSEGAQQQWPEGLPTLSARTTGNIYCTGVETENLRMPFQDYLRRKGY